MFYLLTYPINMINAYIPCTISKMMMPSENYNSLMAAFPHISTTNSGLVWFPMGTSP